MMSVALLTRYPDGQALVGELVDDVEHPEFPAVMGAPSTGSSKGRKVLIVFII
jgi:hypothetical protein